MRLKTIECIESARSRWRTIEAIQGGLDFTSLKAIDDDNRVDAAGFRGANYIADAALPVVLRLTLAQPIVTGEGEEKFTFAERMGFQSLWEHRNSGHWGTRRRHDAVMRIFGATMNKLLSGGKTCVFEKDADFSRSCFVEGGKKHRPDMVIDNAFDDNVKIVFDLTNVAPLTRRGTDILAVDNHLEDAEEKKRSSPAWANFVPLDGLTSEFVPFALGWYGDMGEVATSFIRRVVDHHVRDEYTAAWRMRKILAAIQTRHLNILGVYLQNCRFDMESKGPILDRSHGSKWQRTHLCEKACGIKGPPQSFHCCVVRRHRVWRRVGDRRCRARDEARDEARGRRDPAFPPRRAARLRRGVTRVGDELYLRTVSEPSATAPRHRYVMETIFARHELHHVSLQGFSFIIHRTCSSFTGIVSFRLASRTSPSTATPLGSSPRRRRVPRPRRRASSERRRLQC